MGLFDSVMFRCKKCGAVVEAQSKVGDCDLIDYQADSVPVNIAADIVGKPVRCVVCDAHYTVSAPALPTAVPVDLEPSDAS